MRTWVLLSSGYVQGMSDLLSPILFITQNEVESFWCLTGFMELVVSAGVGCGVPLFLSTTWSNLLSYPNLKPV